MQNRKTFLPRWDEKWQWAKIAGMGIALILNIYAVYLLRLIAYK